MNCKWRSKHPFLFLGTQNEFCTVAECVNVLFLIYPNPFVGECFYSTCCLRVHPNLGDLVLAAFSALKKDDRSCRITSAFDVSNLIAYYIQI